MELYINILKQCKQYRRTETHRTQNKKEKYVLTPGPQILLPPSEETTANSFLCIFLHIFSHASMYVYRFAYK